jgi:hypothetical protein
MVIVQIWNIRTRTCSICSVFLDFFNFFFPLTGDAFLESATEGYIPFKKRSVMRNRLNTEILDICN